MLLALLLSFTSGPPSLRAINAMVAHRDVSGLTRLLAPLPAGARNPFQIVKTGGAYDVGRYGWHAEELQAADGRATYVVLSTPLTSEDTGELLFKRTGNLLKFIPEADAMGVRVRGHRFDLRFDIPSKRAFLTDDLRLDFAPSAPQAIFFRMSPNYKVRSIAFGAKKLKFRQAGGIVSMLRERAGNYRVTYDAKVDLPNYAGSISPQEATLVNDYWYPMVARQPSPYEIAIYSPRGWTAVAQGEKLSQTEGKQERLTRFRMGLPVVYFSVIAGPFNVASEQLGPYRYSAWSTRVSTSRLALQAELYRPIFEFYASSFGPPPYPMYGAVDSRFYGGGALEAYTFATYGGGVPSEDAHEPAHTWWGGRINNTYLGSFWNESFAVFSDGLYHRNAPIGNVEERRLAFVSDASAEPAYNAAAIVGSGAEIGSVGSALGYGKGAKVLQMLEQWLGTNEIVQCMRQWMSTHPRGVPGDWPDFERVVLSRSHDPRIRDFLHDWLRRPGYARFSPTVDWQDGFLSIRLNWIGPGFTMPLTVMTEASGRRKFETVLLDRDTDVVRLARPAKPDLISIDPYRQVLREIATSEAPVDLGTALHGLSKIVDPAHPDWMTNVGPAPSAGGVGNPDGPRFLVGSPETFLPMRKLCQRVGFEVRGNSLTYRGTTIDLRHGGALATVEVSPGRYSVIGLGKTLLAPNWGRAHLVLTDEYGRFLRGETEPKTAGALTFRLKG